MLFVCSLCDMFLCLLSTPHLVYFLWSQKNRCIIETWDILLWEWKLDFSHTRFYSSIKYRSPKFSSQVRIILDVIFEIIIFKKYLPRKENCLKYIRQLFRNSEVNFHCYQWMKIFTYILTVVGNLIGIKWQFRVVSFIFPKC